jgi:hypothetical protein
MTDFFQLGNLRSNSGRYFGVLLSDEDGVFSTRVIQGARWRDELLGQVGQVRALVIGMGELARANLAAVMPVLQHAQEALESDVALTTPLPPRSGGYVYLYFRDAVPSWRNVFYIGMSESDPRRGASHLRSFLKGRREVSSPKTFEIDRALKALEDKSGQQIGSMKRYREVADSSGGSYLFRHTFTGLTPLQAFMVEHYLIQRLGPYTVSNETGGNGVHGDHEALVLPANLAQSDAKWREAVTMFLDQGSLSDRLRAELNLTSLAPVAAAFNRALANSPLSHILMAHELEYCRVANGQDMTLNYVIRSSRAPFRLELLASRKEASLRINLRPAGDKNYFAKYLRARGLIVSGAMYCKPFAPQGNGRCDVFFPAWPDTKGLLQCVTVPEGLDWLPHGRPAQMNIFDACTAVLKYLLPQDVRLP